MLFFSNIQVPEECAKHLGTENISCSFRDEIHVKGKGNMKVYYIDMDHENFLVEIDKELAPEEMEKERYRGNYVPRFDVYCIYPY